MLVLTRKLNERIKIGEDIEIVVVDLRHGQARIGIVAPRDVDIVRTELIREDSK